MSALLHEPWPSRHRQAKAYRFGMWAFLGSEALFFGALFFIYAALRTTHGAALEAAARQTNLTFGVLNTFILLASSGAVAASERLSESQRGKASAAMVAAALLLGVAFLGVKLTEYHEDLARHLVPAAFDGVAASFWSFYWLATSVHALHVVIGLGLFLRLLVFAHRAQLAAHKASLRATALYWHFVDIVWIFLYPLLYLAGRGS